MILHAQTTRRTVIPQGRFPSRTDLRRFQFPQVVKDIAEEVRIIPWAPQIQVQIVEVATIRPKETYSRAWTFSFLGLRRHRVLMAPFCWECHLEALNTFLNMSKTFYLESSSHVGRHSHSAGAVITLFFKPVF